MTNDKPDLSGLPEGLRPIPCPRCDGTGEVEVFALSWRPRVTCPACKGHKDVLARTEEVYAAHAAEQQERAEKAEARVEELEVEVKQLRDENAQLWLVRETP